VHHHCFMMKWCPWHLPLPLLGGYLWCGGPDAANLLPQVPAAPSATRCNSTNPPCAAVAAFCTGLLVV
jgi:hypothetical protein